MKPCIKVAIDAMGGDKAPSVIVEGIDYFLANFDRKNIKFILFGDEKAINILLVKFPKIIPYCEIIHTDEKIEMKMSPVFAMRNFPKSSMRLAIRSVKADECAFVVSGGNTGALMAMSKTIFKMIPGIDRPALCTSFPSKGGKPVTFLDLGADISADASRLTEFSIMGTLFVKILHKIKSPKLGLLNIGTESGKGKPELDIASQFIEKTFKGTINYKGFVEGSQLFSGEFDVFVMDGFTGNNVLKAIEGLASFLIKEMISCFGTNFIGKLRLLVAKKPLKKLIKSCDPRMFNGAVLLGTKKIVVKSHGGADALAYSYAINTGLKLHEGNFINKLETTIAPYTDALKALRVKSLLMSNQSAKPKNIPLDSQVL